ncbi:hypothetical protein [Streptomyces sp. Da 82-17]|uniref:hypothetical protein n=1 Tax=Streptomyces sp. Da 82-17 TaxID=3377116 RepID=UPI0038D444BE
MTANDPVTETRSDASTVGPDRYRLVHESRAEYVLPLPSTIPAAVELLDIVRSALRAEGRSVTDAAVHQGEGAELVISYQVSADRNTVPMPQVPRRKVGFE